LVLLVHKNAGFIELVAVLGGCSLAKGLHLLVVGFQPLDLVLERIDLGLPGRSVPSTLLGESFLGLPQCLAVVRPLSFQSLDALGAATELA
jgi:hypothetical protein